MEKLSKEEKALVVSQTLYFFGGALASVFLSIYLFKLGGYPAVTFFYFLLYFLLVIIYILSGYLLKKVSTKTLLVTSQVLSSIFWAVLFILKSNAIVYLFPLGVLYGISAGFFWSGVNLTQYIVSRESQRNIYFGWVTAWSNVVRGLAPILGGIIITTSLLAKADGYSIIFLIVLIINVINIFVALRLPFHSGILFSLNDFLKHKRSFIWKRVLTQQFLLGLWDVSVTNLLGVMLYLILTSELSVGITNAIQSLVAAGGAALTPYLLRKFPRSPVLAGFISGIGLIIFAQYQNMTGLVILTASTIFAFQIIAVPLSTAVLAGLDNNPVPWQQKYHMLIERDAVLGIARSLSFVFLWWAFSQYSKETVAPVWLMAIAIFPPILGFFVTAKNKNNEMS